jgi:hypothetical protein
MAVELIYDNGIPFGVQAAAGSQGSLLAYSETNGNATITFDAGSSPIFTPSDGDVAVVYNTSDFKDFAVFYVTGITISDPLSDHPVAITAKIDKNFYQFAKVSGKTYYAIIYSVALYSDLIQDFANTYSVETSIEKSHYSDLMISYSKKISHVITVDNLRRNFWSSRDALMADTLFLVEECDKKAYKISISDSTFEVFNNKFKNNVSFNLASSKV